jgi:cytochrome P450
MSTDDPYDPFRQAREADGSLESSIAGTSFTMFLRHADVRAICRDYRTFTSATPFRVPIPPEHDIRPTAQLPIESDPPLHSAYRRLMDDHFSRSAVTRHSDDIVEVARSLLDPALAAGHVEVVAGFALPLFLHSLAMVLGRPAAEVERWRSWGTQALAAETEPGTHRNSDLDRYIDDAVDASMTSPGDDFFGHLARGTVEGRPLARDEIRGFANLAFAGGRQTVVYAITNVLHHLATSPESLVLLAREPERIPTAIEEYVRFMTPIAHLGRTTTADVDVAGRRLAAGTLVSICFASANRDAAEFDAADELRLDRKPNRHVAFGHGPHTCVGAPMARLVLQIAIEQFVSRCAAIELAGDPVPHRDDIGFARAQQGYDVLELRLTPA